MKGEWQRWGGSQRSKENTLAKAPIHMRSMRMGHPGSRLQMRVGCTWISTAVVGLQSRSQGGMHEQNYSPVITDAACRTNGIHSSGPLACLGEVGLENAKW